MNLSSFVASAVIVSGMGVGAWSAQPAGAAQNNDYCGNRGAVTCAYRSPGYLNGLGYRSANVGLADISSANRNALSAWENLTPTGARFYYNLSGRGTCVPMMANSSRTVSSENTSNPDNNQAESWAFNGTC
ncbi:hypothetical protein [Nocardioides rubriscoriae]|uniref:hypothetical protein n=1 Tax=Nocardioides rubriscoriae TaxID=642762 RepID=UPI0011DFA7DC|nr:hypothetical protein [Nocardioides rubriscoriae]